jgi:hypothetical protein
MVWLEQRWLDRIVRMSARNNGKRGFGTLRALAVTVLAALSALGCSAIIGLGDYTVAGSGGSGGGLIGEAGKPSVGSGGLGGSAGGSLVVSEGGEAGTPGTSVTGTVGCDNTTTFTPNPDIVRSCLLRAGCDPNFDPVRTISTCVSYDTQAALPGETCNLTSKTCADYTDCEHIGVAHDDLCGTGQVTRCDGGLAINCGNYTGDDRFFDCTALGGTCGSYTYSNNQVYTDCVLDISPDSCAGMPDDDSSFYCHAGSSGNPDLRYYCWGGQAYGASCTLLGKCEDAATDGGDATCYFNLQTCTAPATPTCKNGVANDCSKGDLFKYDCSTVGLTCDITDQTEYCLAPGCTSDDVETNCTESCSDDGTQLTFCYGGAPYTVTCSDYGFTQCLASTDDNGNSFAACRY